MTNEIATVNSIAKHGNAEKAAAKAAAENKEKR